MNRTNPPFGLIIWISDRQRLSETKSEQMVKPLPKTILKPRTVGGDVAKPNVQSRSQLAGHETIIVHLGDGACWDLDKAANPHMVILGTSGSGKTQTLKAVVWEMYQRFPTRSIAVLMEAVMTLKHFKLN